jgi:hypothetical protein
MAQLVGSVGLGGQNRRDDVIIVQAPINAKLPVPLSPLEVDGICGDKTKFAIKEYQRRNLAMNRPDGRVDPGGMTFRSLVGGQVGPVGPTPPVVPTPPTGPVAGNVSRPAEMRESAWRYLLQFTKKHEGAVFHMYNNRTASQTKQDVTCGIGFLIDPRSAATQAWLKAMFYDPATKLPPTDTQMLADWDAAAALARTGKNLPEYGKVCLLRMYPDRVYERMALILRDQKLPALLSLCRDDFKDFKDFPAAAQVFGLSFAYGRIPLDFPKMRESIRNQRWSEAADRCHVRGMSPIKDQAHRQLLLFA